MKILKILGSILVFLLVAGAISLVYWLSWNGDLPYPKGVTELSERGQFGDSFGAVNALVSSLAFLGVFLTVWIQGRQISQQAKELQRQAQRDSENQERNEIDQYERLLFRLLGFYLEAVEGVRIVRKGKEYVGRDAISRSLQLMQETLKQRKIHFLPAEALDRIKNGTATAEQLWLLDYLSMETFRVVQYTIGYQRRLVSTLLSLLRHLENRCPQHAEIRAYRSLVCSQITHVEVQYIFNIALVYANEAELRDLLHRCGLFHQDSSPYNFRFHKFLYEKYWGKTVGDKELARHLPLNTKEMAEIRSKMDEPVHASLLRKYKISEPYRPETSAERTETAPATEFERAV
ncbi:hypothetical protein CupriaWKF_12545 [Cupriavidus sp. WKF15]|uniref:hypothetical protein n=1 Tax=Cupriavidus sp. WKF15 TaxID=3032282 RepID=UPI0023E282B5|nr:hypothetical protein [Cupriavidus sp. WKF15]WER45136.1 hypothetical protein CupriaWKF_12545 [Cupriavidus sp. WKF15]